MKKNTVEDVAGHHEFSEKPKFDLISPIEIENSK